MVCALKGAHAHSQRDKAKAAREAEAARHETADAEDRIELVESRAVLPLILCFLGQIHSLRSSRSGGGDRLLGLWLDDGRLVRHEKDICACRRRRDRPQGRAEAECQQSSKSQHRARGTFHKGAERAPAEIALRTAE